ncbi:MAG: amidohydrolase family protein [Planctomycetota bacterium]|nr:amidohydrolase family protein [Planctomycetota bacterium]
MRRSLFALAVGLLAVLLLGFLPPARADEDDEEEAETATARAKWNVEDPGGPYRELAFDTDEGTWMSVDVHPDGSRVVFDLLGDLYTVPLAGGAATRLTSGLAYDIQPRYSPDGAHILFTSDRAGGDNVWVMNADGTKPRALTKESYRLFNNAVWHPTGRWIVGKKHFTSTRSLGAGEMWMIPFPEGGHGVRLTERKNDQQDVGEPALSPDGRHLYWSEDMSGGSTFEYNKDPHGIIYVIRGLDMHTGEIRDVIRRPGGAIRPQPSPDGSSLAFVRRRGRDTVLSLFHLKTGRVRDVWAGLSRDQQETWAIFGPHPGFAWTPDAKSIVIQGQGGLWKVDVMSGTATAIPFKAHVEQRLCPTRRIEHTTGGAAFDVKVIRWPQVTADGKAAVFQALGQLYRRDLATGAVARITAQTEELEFAPQLTPDGTRIVYTTWHDERGGRVRSVKLDGSEGRTLVEWPGHYVSAVLSPDGSEVLVERDGPDVYRGSTYAEDQGIWRIPLASGAEPIFVTRKGTKPRYAPGGARILVQRSEGKRRTLVSLDPIGSDPRVVATSERAVDYVVSPDGRWLAFEELWNAYVCPLPPQPTALEVGPDMKEVPVQRLSKHAGTYLSFSADSQSVRWSLGAELSEATRAKDGRRFDVKPDARTLGWSAQADMPTTDVWLVGAAIAPMHDESVIEDGVVHVRGNRIVAVGRRADLPVPADAQVLDVTGTTIIPGLVDVHSHTGSSGGSVYPRRSWALDALLAFGVTTTHDPSNGSQMIHAEAELVEAGQRLGPRLFSTGTILYGAEGDFKAVIKSYDDAYAAIKRTAAWGARSVKSYQQPRREQRQQVVKAAADLGIMVMPEGGSTLHYNITHMLDGHTTLEHAIPVAPLYKPELELLAKSGTCYTPTLVVGYGGFWGENYWYAKTRVWENERLLRFVPPSVVMPGARRRTLLTDDEEYNHFRLARTCAEVYRRGGNVEIGAHGQLQGLGSHWETWMLVQGGLTPHQALRCATWGGARAICLEDTLGSIQAGMLADLLVIEGSPLDTMEDSERIRFTMKNGRLYDARTLEQILPTRQAPPRGPALDAIRGAPGHANCACGR